MLEIIEPALQESFASVTAFLAECKGQLNAQVNRLRELRLKKAEDPREISLSTPSRSCVHAN